MALLKRGAIPEPMAPAEAVQVDELGGEVCVRAIPLPAYLAWATAEGPRLERLTALLALAVVDADGEQIFTAAQWDAFSARHRDATYRLLDVANRLNGVGEQKNG